MQQASAGMSDLPAPPRSTARRPRTSLIVAILGFVTMACTCGLLPSAGEILRGVDLPDGSGKSGAEGTTQGFGESEPSETADLVSPTLEPASTDPSGSSITALVDEGSLLVEDIAANSTGSTEGPVLTLQLTNLKSGEVVVQVPCGLVFRPRTDDDQRMMVIQPASVMLGGSSSGELSPYVICIDSSKDAPDLAATYQVGVMAKGDLLEIANCLCEYDLSGNADQGAGLERFGVQFAVWAVSDETPIDAIFGDESLEGGAMEDMFGDEFADMVGELTDLFLAPAQGWLDRCAIEIE